MVERRVLLLAPDMRVSLGLGAFPPFPISAVFLSQLETPLDDARDCSAGEFAALQQGRCYIPDILPIKIDQPQRSLFPFLQELAPTRPGKEAAQPDCMIIIATSLRGDRNERWNRLCATGPAKLIIIARSTFAMICRGDP